MARRSGGLRERRVEPGRSVLVPEQARDVLHPERLGRARRPGLVPEQQDLDVRTEHVQLRTAVSWMSPIGPSNGFGIVNSVSTT